MITRKVRCVYGDFVEVKTVNYDKALKYMPSAQAGVVFKKASKETILVSYASCIVSIADNKAVYFYNTAPNCSRTTIRHVIMFLKEYLPMITYQQIKKAFIEDDTTPWIIQDNKLINPYTGEVI